jgi:biotin operon repressor
MSKPPATPHDLLAVLAKCIGTRNAVRIDELARRVGCSERKARTLVSALREEGYAVCAHPAVGYYIAVDDHDINETCRFLRSRALHSLRIESRLRNIPLPDLLGQLHLET